MKKALSLITALLLVMAFAGCSKKQVQAPNVKPIDRIAGTYTVISMDKLDGDTSMTESIQASLADGSFREEFIIGTDESFVMKVINGSSEEIVGEYRIDPETFDIYRKDRKDGDKPVDHVEIEGDTLTLKTSENVIVAQKDYKN